MMPPRPWFADGRNRFVVAQEVQPEHLAYRRRELERHLSAMIVMQRTDGVVHDAVIQPGPLVARDTANVDVLARTLAGMRMVVRVRGELDHVAVRNALAAAVRLAVDAGVRVAVAQVRLAPAAARTGIRARGVAARVLALAAGVFARLARLEQDAEAQDHERAVARQEREQPPRQRQREEPVTFGIAAGPRLEHVPRVRELVPDVEQRPAVTH